MMMIMFVFLFFFVANNHRFDSLAIDLKEGKNYEMKSTTFY